MPPSIYVHQGPVNVNLFGDQRFAVVINLKRGHNRIGWCPWKKMDARTHKCRCTRRRKPHGDRCITVITRVRRTRRMAASPSSQEEGTGRILSRSLSERTAPDTRCSASRTLRGWICLFKSPLVWYSVMGALKLIHNHSLQLSGGSWCFLSSYWKISI